MKLIGKRRMVLVYLSIALMMIGRWMIVSRRCIQTLGMSKSKSVDRIRGKACVITTVGLRLSEMTVARIVPDGMIVIMHGFLLLTGGLMGRRLAGRREVALLIVTLHTDDRDMNVVD